MKKAIFEIYLRIMSNTRQLVNTCIVECHHYQIHDIIEVY